MRKLVLLTVSVCLMQIAFTQDADQPIKKGFDKSRIVLGGNLGATFGNTTSIIISPQIGYKVTDYLVAGVGFNYQYLSQKVYDNVGGYAKYNDKIVGGNVFARVYPSKNFVLQLQPEINKRWSNYDYGSGYTSSRFSKTVTSLLVGGGFVLPISGNVGLNAMIYYDLLQNDYSPYGRAPFYSLGFSAGL